MEAHQEAHMERIMNRYLNGHRDLRQVIEEAREKISSVSAEERPEAVNELIDVLHHPGIKQYHHALVCGLVAGTGDAGVTDLADYATRCIAACRYIIEDEGLTPESNARQPFEDLISGAREVIEQLERAAEADRFLEEVMRARDEQNLVNGGLDEMDLAFERDLTDEDSIIYGAENDAFDLVGSIEQTGDDIINEVFGSGIAVEGFPERNAVRIPAGRQIQEEEAEVQAVFQHDVSVEDAELVNAFIELVPEHRELMQELLRKASSVAGIPEDQMIEQLQHARHREYAIFFERAADEDESVDQDGDDGQIKIDIEIDLDDETETDVEIEINTREL